MSEKIKCGICSKVIDPSKGIVHDSIKGEKGIKTYHPECTKKVADKLSKKV